MYLLGFGRKLSWPVRLAYRAALAGLFAVVLGLYLWNWDWWTILINWVGSTVFVLGLESFLIANLLDGQPKRKM